MNSGLNGLSKIHVKKGQDNFSSKIIYLVLKFRLLVFPPPIEISQTFGSLLTSSRVRAYGCLEKNCSKHFCPNISAGRFFVVPGTMDNTFL